MLWVNGSCVEPGGVHVSALDRGFTMADGLFETMRAQRGVVFRADRHLERLAHGARVLGIALPDSIKRWLRAALASPGAAELDEVAVRLTVSRGVTASGLAVDDDSSPTVVIALQPLPVFPAELYTAGLLAVTAAARRNEHGATAGIKTLSYTEAIVALTRARAAGADEAIVLDTEGHLSEATASNLFLCTSRVLVTPPLSCGVLPGVTREAVIELARSSGVKVEERPVEAHELAAADEAFLTSSLRGLAPLVRVDHRDIGRGHVGPITRSMTFSYTTLVDRECAS